MKTLDRLKFIILFLLFISQTYAQYSNPNSYKKPFVTFDLNFGYAAPSFDLAGTNIKDFYNLSNYATQNGFNANFTTKFTIANLQPDWQVRTYLTISYAQFMGSEDRASNIGGFIKTGWPRTGLQDSLSPFTKISDTTGKSSIRLNHPYIAYGWEMAWYPDRNRKSVLNFGLDFDISVIFGRIYDQPTGKAEIYNNIIANTRLGLGLNLGYSYRVVNMLGLTIGTRMQISNLFTKKYEEVTNGGDLPLIDEANNGITSLLSKNRSIGFFGIYGGLTFYIGGTK